MSEWRPIETAPRDGTFILATGQPENYGRDDDAAKRHRNAVIWWANDCWWYCCFDSGYYGEWCHPTHWMPLPPPPDAHNTHPAVNAETTNDTDGGDVA